MAQKMLEGCGSCVPYDADLSCCDEWNTYDPHTQCRAVTMAWDILRLLSGGQVGNCPVLLRPCLQEPCNECSTRWMDPHILDGEWVNTPCYGNNCSCGELCEIVLPGKVADIWSITIDGCQVDANTYRVDNFNRLVRTNGECWPSCQYLDRPPEQEGTMAVWYIPGVTPNASGMWAAGILACEVAKACMGQKCRLPASVTSITRQGVSMTMDEGMFSNGLTGIREVDVYLKTINPNGLMIPSTVWSPDLPHHRYTTWDYGAVSRG